jgi:hypothetical protein
LVGWRCTNNFIASNSVDSSCSMRFCRAVSAAEVGGGRLIVVDALDRETEAFCLS